jgi:hypothetical protein
VGHSRKERLRRSPSTLRLRLRTGVQRNSRAEPRNRRGTRNRGSVAATVPDEVEAEEGDGSELNGSRADLRLGDDILGGGEVQPLRDYPIAEQFACAAVVTPASLRRLPIIANRRAGCHPVRIAPRATKDDENPVVGRPPERRLRAGLPALQTLQVVFDGAPSTVLCNP